MVMATEQIPVNLKLCNIHLLGLYQAIERGDISSVYKIENKLTYDEECVACAYALRATGAVKQVLDSFLKHEGFALNSAADTTFWGMVGFWSARIAIILGLFGLFVTAVKMVKIYLLSFPFASIGAFGLVGAFVLTLSSFVLLEDWLFE